MKIIAISDTHTRHRDLVLPEGDVLIHSGDFMGSGREAMDIIDFASWMRGQTQFEHKIVVAGNHERMFEDEHHFAVDLLTNDTGITYLENSSTIIDGVKFYGSPYTPAFCGWAFQLNSREEAVKNWNLIPKDTDVLITHGPAYGMLDQILHPVSDSYDKSHLGCKDLHNKIDELNPKVHIFGHIHSSQGVLDGYGEVTTHINAACLGEGYEFSNNNNYIEWEI